MGCELLQGKLLEVCLLQFVGSEILCRVFGREPSPFIFITASMCAVYTLHTLLTFARLPMTLDGRTHPTQGTILLLLFPTFCILLILLLALLPAGWLDIDTDQAGRGIMHGYTVIRGAWDTVSNLLQIDHEPASTHLLESQMTETGSWKVCMTLHSALSLPKIVLSAWHATAPRMCIKQHCCIPVVLRSPALKEPSFMYTEQGASCCGAARNRRDSKAI